MIDLNEFYQQCQKNIIEIIKHCMIDYRAIKFNLSVYGTYVKQRDDGETVSTIKHFRTAYKSLYIYEDIVNELNSAIECLLTLSSEFQEKDSGWAIQNFDYFETTIIKLENIPASGYIQAPKKIRARNALINVQNTDVFCFKWCILASIANKAHENASFSTPQQRKYSREKMTKPKNYNININDEIIIYDGITLNFSGIIFPIDKLGVRHFEKNNADFSINIYEIDEAGEKIIGPTVQTKERRPNHINILGIDNIHQNMMHYAYITNVFTLCSSQFSKAKSGGYFCENCLQCYHVKNTTHNKFECGKVASFYPEPNTKTSFKGYHKKLSPPVVIYADIEAVLESYRTCLNSPSSSSTTKVQKHTACAVSFYVVHKYNPSQNDLWTYDGDDCMQKFCTALKQKTSSLYNIYWSTPKKPSVSPIDVRAQEGNCTACVMEINAGDLDKCYNQFTGQYVGPIHKNCKPKYKLSDPFFPVVFTTYRNTIYICSLQN
ncbi:uncharacterized protein LOC128263670 [Drosophila gunungcola]|uniref:uncharacterized protein LOC128263670 n=1 Tax=Drosophila gunungcola TaxID=103775 RepID=UPI0022E22F0F|nr:uncharacterized protein LOC128263670 [Drosophila gunungcola]